MSGIGRFISAPRLGLAVLACALVVPAGAASAAPFEDITAADSSQAAPSPSPQVASPDGRDRALQYSPAAREAPAAVVISPDGRDRALGYGPSAPQQPTAVAISPDGRDRALGYSPSAPQQPTAVVAAPDARDRAIGYDPPATAVSQPVAATSDSDGFDWASAAIGAGILGVVALMGLGGVAYSRRRHGDVTT